MAPDHARGAVQARRVVLAFLAALAACALLALVQQDTGPVGRTLLAAFLVLPLALPLRGLLRRDRRTYAWATLCLTPHFVYALTELVANPSLRPTAIGMLVSATGSMAALVAYLRLTRGEAVAASPAG